MPWRRVDLVLKEASDVLWGACSARKIEDQVRIKAFVTGDAYVSTKWHAIV
jgi:hypothetical protein